jgi:hypothetical protein
MALAYRCTMGMLFCMRTTLNLDDELLVGAKELAARNRTTLTAVIEDALRDKLNEADRGEQLPPIDLPVSRMGGGARPGVDLDDAAALLDLLEAGAPSEKRGR